MTTTIKVTSHNYPALVTITYTSAAATPQSQIVTPESGECIFHCTTSTTVSVVDLEYDDPRVLAAKDKT